MSYKPEFMVSGVWYDNTIRLATKEEAESNARDKFAVWTHPSDWRVVESPDTVNYSYTSGTLVAVVQS